MADSLGGRPLLAGHRCRTDDLAYTSVSVWFADHHGRVPIQAAAALGQYIRATGCTFGEAFTVLTNGGPLILIGQEEPPSPDEPG